MASRTHFHFSTAHSHSHSHALSHTTRARAHVHNTPAKATYVRRERAPSADRAFVPFPGTKCLDFY